MSFSIIITSKDELNAFVRNTAAHTKMKPTQLKSAIIKGKGFSHISQAEKAFDDNQAIENNYKERIDTLDNDIHTRILSHADDEHVNDDRFTTYEAFERTYAELEDTVSGEAHRLSKQDQLAEALTVLEVHGFKEVAENIASVAEDGAAVAYLFFHSDKITPKVL